MVAFQAVRDRIECKEGVLVFDLVHQAVDVWSCHDADSRHLINIAATQFVVDRIRGDAR